MFPSNNKFDQLKKKWLAAQDSRSAGNKERKLLMQILKWTGEFIKGAGEDDGGIGASGCGEQYDGKEVTEKVDKEVCTFILGNLWKIHDKTYVWGTRDINKEMEAYVYCAVMSAWLYWYKDKNCGADRVMEHAFEKMRLLCGPPGKGGKCYNCEYEKLEKMKIGNIDILGTILGIVKNENNAMGDMYNKIPENKCKQEKISRRPQAIEPVGGKMTAQQFHFLSSLLTKWIMEKGMANVNQFGKGIWAGLGKIFENLMNTLRGEETEIATSCATGKKENGENITPWTSPEKELCKAMLKVMLYTNGLTQNLRVRNNVADEDEVTTYLRCLVGTLVLVELYGKHCRFEKVLPHVSRVVREKVKEKNLKMTGDICYNQNLEEVKVGGKLIGATIKEWINEGGWNSDNKVGKYTIVMGEAKSCSEDAGNKGAEGAGAGSKKNVAGVTSEEGIKKLKEVMKEGKTVSKEDADSVITNVVEKGLMTDDDIKKVFESELERKIQEAIKKQTATSTLTIDQETCTISGLDDQEQDNWDELFTQFSNVPSDADKNGVYDKWVGMKSVCEKNVLTEEDLSEQEKFFCEVLIRNLIIANEHKYDCEKKSVQLAGGKNKPCVGKCDLLTIWLTYVKGRCVSEELIKYAYEAMEQLETKWNNKDVKDLCKYGETSNLYRNNNDILNAIIVKMACDAKRGKMNNVHNSNWCNDKNRQYTANILQGVARTGSTRQQPTKGNELIKQLKEIEKETKGQLDEVKREVEESVKATSSSSSGGTCTDGSLCDRVKCVSEKWRWNREDRKGVTFGSDWVKIPIIDYSPKGA